VRLAVDAGLALRATRLGLDVGQLAQALGLRDLLAGVLGQVGGLLELRLGSGGVGLLLGRDAGLLGRGGLLGLRLALCGGLLDLVLLGLLAGLGLAADALLLGALGLRGLLQALRAGLLGLLALLGRLLLLGLQLLLGLGLAGLRLLLEGDAVASTSERRRSALPRLVRPSSSSRRPAFSSTVPRAFS
jgi:hypothetical protein